MAGDICLRRSLSCFRDCLRGLVEGDNTRAGVYEGESIETGPTSNLKNWTHSRPFENERQPTLEPRVGEHLSGDA